jgi:hypothetical protein
MKRKRTQLEKELNIKKVTELTRVCPCIETKKEKLEQPLTRYELRCLLGLE